MKTRTIKRVRAKCCVCREVKWVCPEHVIYECHACGGCDVAKVKGAAKVRL